MIKRLELKNIALIKHAIIDFENGLNVLSGETGSGKSVIVDSINFVLGAKADKSMIRHGENDCFASVSFDITNNQSTKDVLNDLGTEYDDEVIVSRRFTTDSKSTIRVNGEPYTLSMLKQVTQTLVDVHGQSEHYSLTKKSEQLKVLDRFTLSGLEELKLRNKELVKRLKDVDGELKNFGGSEAERAIRTDILKFQIEEIENAELIDGEEDELLIKKKKIQSAEKIADSLSAVEGGISGDGCITDILGETVRRIGQITSLDQKYADLYERLKNVSVELSDIGDTASDYLSEIDFNEMDADRIEDRLDKIKSLKKKYGSTVAEINEFLENAKCEYQKLINFDAEYEGLLNEKSKLLKELNALYLEISKVRRQSSVVFADKVTAHLRQLGMKDATFKVEFAPLENITDAPYPDNGNDEIDFVFSANLGEPLKSLAKIISGGEMSRFMLSLKAIIAEYQDISTYIFDEIDVGISGKTAQTVAEKFIDISKKVQVIAISHLPQICAFADNSYLIEKFTEDGKTYTSINKLSEEQKINEIVRIIGGTDGGNGARLHATEMIKIANSYKNG
ncbi:MAG: DNA repair protein RecN [Clostridiales bacterium]|nr:DNA repair protein RecN [Clostridiales bacterium]